MMDCIIVVDKSRIERLNNCFLFVLLYKAEKYSYEFIVEDGKITEVRVKDKIIKGGI